MEGSTPNQLLQICSVSAKLKFDLCCEHHLINSLNSTSDSQSPHAKNVIQISFTFFPNNFRAFLITESCVTAICHPANFVNICLQSLIFSISGNFPGELSEMIFQGLFAGSRSVEEFSEGLLFSEANFWGTLFQRGLSREVSGMLFPRGQFSGNRSKHTITSLQLTIKISIIC